MNPIILLYSFIVMSGTTQAALSHAVSQANSDSLLTVEAVAEMTNVWELTKNDNDSIYSQWNNKDLEYPHELYFNQIGLAYIVNPRGFKVISTQYPSIATHFKKAGITPEQYDNYNDMILRAEFQIHLEDVKTDTIKWRIIPPGDSMFVKVIPTSVERANMDFVKSHEKELNDLRTVIYGRIKKSVKYRPSGFYSH